MSKPFLRAALMAGTVFLLPFGSQAAETRYGTWAPPGSSQGTTSSASAQNLLNDLKALVDEAEKARAADRLFLKDLRDLMARYERPWTERILFDDFHDGEFKTNPAWSVSSGEFWVEQGYGLRSKAVAGAATSSSNDGNMSKEQLAISILGAVLQGANKNGGTTTTTAPAKAEPAVLRARTRISNAFAIASDFSSWKDEGSYAFAVSQGDKGAGYRVIYSPKQAARGATMELVRVTSRGQGTIDKVSLNTLEDQKPHSLDWTRAKDGSMTVSIDGKKSSAHATPVSAIRSTPSN